MHDVVIIGGGPSGLSAALAFGRARKRVLLCDVGPRRNAAAVHMQNFVPRLGDPGSALGFLVDAAHASHAAPFAMMARGFTTRGLTVFGELPDDVRAQLRAADIAIAAAPVRRLVARDGQLTAVELADGTAVACEALFVQPPQRQVTLVDSLGLAVEDGYLKIDAMTREASRPGIYARGDLTTRMQSAIIAAASGMQAAAMLNMELSADIRS